MNDSKNQMQRGEFLKHYGNLVANLWENPDLLSSLQAQPAALLASFGLVVPPDAHIELNIQPAEEVDEDRLPDAQFAMWTQGFEAKRFNFVIPRRPLDFDHDMGIPLRDEVLDLIAGGNMDDVPACCPCCSCENGAVN